MQPLVFDINDTALRVIDGSETVAVEPGFALADDGAVTVTGTAAAAQSRLRPRAVLNDYWYRLDAKPVKSFPGLTRADFASAQVAAMLPPERFAGREVLVVVPSDMRREALGLLFGVLKANQLEPRGLVDAAVAATHARYVDRTALHVELGLHAGAVSRLYQTNGVSSLEDVRAIEGSGLIALRDAWAKYFAAEFVRQCRFDPMHSADSEQTLYDRLSGWLERIEAGGSATLTLEAGGRAHEVAVDRVDVINVVAGHYQRLAATARALLPICCPNCWSRGSAAPGTPFRTTPPSTACARAQAESVPTPGVSCVSCRPIPSRPPRRLRPAMTPSCRRTCCSARARSHSTRRR